MKAAILGLAIIASSTTAMAGGIYNDTTSAPLATSTANTMATLWTSNNVPGGSVSLGNVLRIHVRASGADGTGDIYVYLNGVLLAQYPADLGDQLVADIYVERISNTQAVINASYSYPGSSLTSVEDGGQSAVGGLSWTSAQTVVIKGKSNATSGIILQQAGVQR